MRHLLIGLFILLGFLVGQLWAGDLKEIELLDGSVIYGEILSLSDGVYTFESNSLGTIRIKEGRIRAIRSKTSPVTSGIPLEAMKQKFGNSTGTLIHTVAYTFLPLVCGVIITFAGINGISLG